MLRAPKKGESSNLHLQSEEKSDNPVTSLFLQKSGLVMLRAAQIPTETEATACPEVLSIRGEKQQRRAALSGLAGLRGVNLQASWA